MIPSTRSAATITVGEALPAFDREFTTADLMAYGAATWDWNRLHFDLDYVRAKNLPNVVVDGQMLGALFAKHALDWAGPRGFIQRMNFRMRAMTFAGDSVHGEGEVMEVRAGADQDVAVLTQRLLKGDQLVAESTTEIRLSR